MTLQEIVDGVWQLVRAVAAALGPAALGSAVAQAWKTGLSWRQRLVQWVVGICVSYFVTRAIADTMGLNDFASQAVGFVIGMMAFEVAPRLVKAAGDTAAQLPDMVRDLVGRLKWPGA